STAAAIMGQLGQRLVAAGEISDEQLEIALDRKRQTGGFLGEVLIEMGCVAPATIGKILEEAIGVPYVDLANVQPAPEALELVSEHYQRRHRVMPYKLESRRLYVAMSDPLNVMVIDDLHLMTGMKIVPHLALAGEISDALSNAYTVKNAAESVLK